MADLEAVRGDTNRFKLSVVKHQLTVDLTGAKIWFTAKHNVEDADSEAAIKLDSVTNPTQIFITDALHGKAEIVLVPTDTAGLAEDTVLRYDVQVLENGNTTTVENGLIEIIPDITRAIS